LISVNLFSANNTSECELESVRDGTRMLLIVPIGRKDLICQTTIIKQQFIYYELELNSGKASQAYRIE